MTELTTRAESRQCLEHGEYMATVKAYPDFEHATSCPTCTAGAKAKRAADEALERQRKVERLRTASGVPARFAEADFHGYTAGSDQMRTAREVLASFAQRWEAQTSGGQSLLLIGGPGTGKTHLACAVVNEIAEKLVRAEYGTAAELVGQVKRHYGRRGGDDQAADALGWLLSVPLLVIDEIDVGLSEHDLTLLFRVIDGRYSDLQPMILISNRPADQLEQLLGHRVMDRLRECAVTVAFSWPSHRGQRRAA